MTKENTGPPAVKPSSMNCEYKLLPVRDIQHLRVTELDLVLHLKSTSAASISKVKAGERQQLTGALVLVVVQPHCKDVAASVLALCKSIMASVLTW